MWRQTYTQTTKNLNGIAKTSLSAQPKGLPPRGNNMRHIFGTQSIFRGYRTLPASCIIFLPITKFHLILAFLGKYCQKNLPSDIFPVSHTFSATCHILPATSPSLAKHRFFFVTSDIPPQLLPCLPSVIVFLLVLFYLCCHLQYFPASSHSFLPLSIFRLTLPIPFKLLYLRIHLPHFGTPLSWNPFSIFS